MGKNINDLSGKVSLDVTSFKAGTAELNRNIRLVESGFKAVAAGMDDWKGSSEGLEARVKALNDITELQRTKVARLAQEHEKIAAEYGASSRAAQDLEIKVNKATEELNKSEKELREVTGALDQMNSAEAQVGAQADKMGGSVKGAATQTGGFKQQITDFAKSSVGQLASITGAVALATKAFKALADIIEESAKWADEILTLSAQTGIATETLQKLEYASRFVDVEMSVMEKGIAKVVKALGEAQAAGSNYIEIADGITVSVYDTNDQIKTSEQLFYDTVDALGEMTDATAREVAAQDLFGKSYQDLMPLIKAGSGALEGYGEKAEDAGVIVNDITVMALGKLDDKLEEVSASAQANGKKLAAGMIRMTDAIASAWQDVVSAINPATVAQEKAVSVVAETFGVTEETAAKMIEMGTAIENVAYITGMSTDEVKAKAESLSGYLITQGADAATAYSESLVYIAQGYDAASLAAEQMTAAQAVWDEQVAAAAANYVALSDQYTAEVEARTQQYLSTMGGLFGAFPEQVNVTGDQLIENLQSQVDGIRGWSENIASLANRGIDEGLLQELRDMGPEAAAEVEALNNMSDEELQQYVALYKENGDLARDAAVTALEPMAEEVAAALKEVENVVANREDAMAELGRNLGEGLGDGITSATSYIKRCAEYAVAEAIVAANEAADSHSPSRKMRDEVGIYMGQGVGIGMIEGLQAMIPNIQDGLQAMTDQLSAGAGSSYTQQAYTYQTDNSSHYQINTTRPVGLREIRQFQIEDEQRRSLEA